MPSAVSKVPADTITQYPTIFSNCCVANRPNAPNNSVASPAANIQSRLKAAGAPAGSSSEPMRNKA
ncbi:hypothetical protein D3C78_1951860 [compost metagenome]